MKFIIENEKLIGNLEFGALDISPNAQVGYRPFELFVSSLTGCSGTLLRDILVKKRQPYDKIEMEVSSIRNPDQANRIEQISINALVYTEKPLSADQNDKISKLVVKNCGMIQSVINCIDIVFTIKSTETTGDE